MNVLLVDDDPDIRMIAAVALRRVGKWDVIVAESGAAALQKVERGKTDLILLDLMMPGLDGLGTLAALRARADVATIPVIFMTAKVQAVDVARYLEAGAVGVIQKPFDPMLLSATVARILAEGPSA